MVAPPRSILHFDLDAFFVSVELLGRPDLGGKPVAVGGRPEGRGVVSSASYEARAFGVRSAMPMRIALQICPELVVLPARHDVYAEWSRKVMAVLYDVTPDVEQMSIDEAYLDVTGTERLWGTAEQVAHMLKMRVRQEFKLPCSIGVATGKLIAKIATERAKPDGICIVPPGHEADFLAPMPIEQLWGIGPKTAAALRLMGVETIGHLACASREYLARRFGSHQTDAMIRHAQGISTSPVVFGREAKQISQEVTFARDIVESERLRRTVLDLSEKVAARLRVDKLDARTIAIKLRYADFTTFTRQMTLAEGTHLSQPIHEAAWSLFQKAWTRRPVRLLGVAALNLGPTAQQLPLFGSRDDRSERLADALDRIGERYGADVVTRASLARSTSSLGRRRRTP